MTQPSTWSETLTAVKARGEFTVDELERYNEATAEEHENHDGEIRYDWCPLCAIETQTRDMRVANDLAGLRGYPTAERYLEALRAPGAWTCETCHLDNNGATCTECGMTPAEASTRGAVGLRDERGRSVEAE